MRKFIMRSGLSLIVLAGLAGCGSNDHSDVSILDPDSPSQLSTFGSTFAKAFKADPSSEPYDAADGDVPALSLTTEPSSID